MERAVQTVHALFNSQAPYRRHYTKAFSRDALLLALEIIVPPVRDVVEHLLAETDDLEIISTCLDVLRFAISTCLFLGLEEEKQPLAALMASYRYELVGEGELSVAAAGLAPSKTETKAGILSDAHLRLQPYVDIMACSDASQALDVVMATHDAAKAMQDIIASRQSYQQLQAVVERFAGGEELLDASRSFILEGSLVKQCTRKLKRYQFFLFNDQLSYASVGFGGKLRLHRSLPLASLTVEDREDEDDRVNCFFLRSPVKSFAVYADALLQKQQWMSALNDACSALVQRKLDRRMSLLPRLEKGSRRSTPTAKSPSAGKGKGKSAAASRSSSKHAAAAAAAATDLPARGAGGSRAHYGRYDSMTELERGFDATLPPVVDAAAVTAEFKLALAFSRRILEGEHPRFSCSDEQKLKFYGLFKQSSSGDCNVARPTGGSWIVPLKWEAWKSQQGRSKLECKQLYIALLDDVAPSWREEE
eukprot:PLAT213.4.p1 GENE.PLAT213.4~~PLAT213.4.p1  ORF type:complete len:477 (+),score=223.71 PLAT213.4:62-1492(+)